MARALPDEDLWTPKEAARYLRIDVRTVHFMASIPKEKGGPPVQRTYTGWWKGKGFKRRALLRFPREAFKKWAADGGTQQCSV